MATDDWSAMSDEEGWEEAGPAIGGSAASRGSPLAAGGAPRSAAIASKPSPPAASSPFAGAPPGATTKHHASGSIDWGDEEDDWRPGPPQSTPPQPAYARPSPGRAALGRSPAASGRITGFGESAHEFTMEANPESFDDARAQAANFVRTVPRDADALPADLVASKREEAEKEARDSGKPQEIAEKIAEGKMRKFFV